MREGRTEPARSGPHELFRQLPQTPLGVRVVRLVHRPRRLLDVEVRARHALEIGVGHAWTEARWHAAGTWEDFRDWLRSGR